MDRTEIAISVLVMGAAGSVLVAPLLGRFGAPLWADLAMACAVGCGLAATAIAALHTVRAARRARPRAPARGPDGSRGSGS